MSTFFVVIQSFRYDVLRGAERAGGERRAHACDRLPPGRGTS